MTIQPVDEPEYPNRLTLKLLDRIGVGTASAMKSCMSVFTQHLKEEHETILRALHLLEVFRSRLSEPTSDLKDLNSLLFVLRKLVEEVHHRKEEELLFKALSETGPLKGGPRCTYFMGRRLEDGVSDTSILSPRRNNLAPALEIPLEEHEIGHQTLMRIGIDLARVNEGDISRKPVLADRILSYIRLMHLHIEKENTCLFEMANSALDLETQAKLLAHAREIDQRAGFTSGRWASQFLDQIESSMNRSAKQTKRASNA